MAGNQRLLVAVIGVLALALLVGPGAAPLGAKGPGKGPAKRMKVRFTPKQAPAGTTFRGVARGFAGGESVTAQEAVRGRRASRLPGGVASNDGRVRVLRKTFSTSKPGERKVCLRGERSQRMACGRYRVTPGGGAPEEDLVLDEGGESPDDPNQEDRFLEFDLDGDLPNLDEDPELLGDG